MACHNMAKTLPIQCHLIFFEATEWVLQYRKIWNEVELQLFEKLITEPIKVRYVHGKLKMWKEHINTTFHGQDVPCTCGAM